MKRLFSSLAAIAIFGMGHASEAVGSPLASFGSDPESVARAMAATSSVNPTSAATVNPAKVLGVFSECGSLDIGKRADFLLLDSNLRLAAVFQDGKQVAGKPNRPEIRPAQL